MREALSGMRNPAELELGLDYAIQIILTELRKDGYRVVFDCKEWPPLLPAEYAPIIYHMVREALMNVQKHAKASTVNVSLFCFEEHLHVCISDDGVGMEETDFATTSHSGYHQGFIGMREWARLLNGCLTIESSPGRGTRIDLDIPYLLEKRYADKGQCNDGLTARESEILVLIARGMLAKEISRTLEISEKTVRNHISSIYRKLKIYDRSQLAIYAVRRGLIAIEY
jgi:DNA-binding CsgD family transcriptional regulator